MTDKMKREPKAAPKPRAAGKSDSKVMQAKMGDRDRKKVTKK